MPCMEEPPDQHVAICATVKRVYRSAENLLRRSAALHPPAGRSRELSPASRRRDGRSISRRNGKTMTPVASEDGSLVSPLTVGRCVDCFPWAQRRRLLRYHGFEPFWLLLQ